MEQQSTFATLVTFLNKLILTYRALFTVANQKKDALIANQIDEVNKLSLQETKIIKPIPDMEKEIRQLLTTMQRELGFRPKLKMGLTELSTLLIEPSEKQTLEDINKELIDITKKLREANELNYQLIQQSLDYVNFSLDVLIGPEEEEYTYKKPTLQQDTIKRSNIYDRKG